MTLALFLTSFLISCTDKRLGALNEAAGREGELSASTYLPDWPSDCNARLSSGVKRGERMAIALRRVDQRLHEQNHRLDRCGAWYGQVQTGFEGVTF